MPITFDPATKRIVLDSASASATDIYSRWVDWVATADNAKYLPAFRAVGGDDLGGGLSIPPYFFLSNGWRVRPMESDHALTIDGNLFVDGGGDPVVPTLGAFNVLAKLVVPVQAQGISTSGGGGASAAEVWSHPSRTLTSHPDPWATVIEDGQSAANLLRLVAAFVAGDATGLTSGPLAFKSLDGSKSRVVGTVVGGTRTVLSRDGA